MSIELSITIKDHERKLTKAFNLYNTITLEESDPTISSCLKEAMDEFKGIPDDIKIKAMMVLK